MRDWKGGELDVGVSAFSGRIENRVDGQRYGHDAAALHAQWQRGPATVQLQWARYRNPEPRAAPASASMSLARAVGTRG